MLSRDDVLRFFTESEALLDGHFLLSSGLHSPAYLEKFKVLQYPKYVEALCAEIASRFAGARIDVVLGPTTGGVLLAYEVAKQLGVRGIFAERDDAAKRRLLRRGFEIRSAERVLLVDDILTTGGSVRETVEVVRESAGELVGIAILADRSGTQPLDLGAPLISLLKLEVESYSPDDCPLCKINVPLTKRGTTPGNI